MSFWKNLFGGGGGSAEAAPAPGEEYKGFTIRPTPMTTGSEYQLAGTIEKTVGARMTQRNWSSVLRIVAALGDSAQAAR